MESWKHCPALPPRHEFDSEQIPDLTKDVYIQDIHCVGSLCKLYFRELPNPLLTYQLYEKFSVSPTPGCGLGLGWQGVGYMKHFLKLGNGYFYEKTSPDGSMAYHNTLLNVKSNILHNSSESP